MRFENEKTKKAFIMLVVKIIIMIVMIPVALFIGKTTQNGWHIVVERPVTALLFYATMIAGLLDI